MTIPINSNLPLHSDRIKEGGDGLDKYMRELVFSLQNQYEQVAQGVNGDFRSDKDTGSRKYTPTIEGTTTAGTATYTRQIGLVLRKGIMVDVWFDLDWTGHTGTGTLNLIMPYLFAVGEGNPFIGTVNTQTISFSGYVSGIGIMDTRQMRLLDSISGAVDANIAMLADGSLRGHIRYIGQEIERS